MKHKIPESTAQRLATEWTLQRLGHGLSYYSTADVLLADFLPKYNEFMDEIEKYNQSVDS